MYCVHCGHQIADEAAVCIHCGRAVTKLRKSEGHVSCGWWWLGFLIPLAGLLVFIFSHDTEPIKAKKAGWGALIGVIASVVLVVLVYVLIFAFAFMMASSF